MRLYEFIDKRLAEQGKKWHSLTKDFGIGCQTLSNIKAGKTTKLSEGTLQKLALALCCSQGDLRACMADEPDPRRKEVSETKKKTVMETVDKLEEMVKEQEDTEIAIKEKPYVTPGPDGEPDELPFGELDTEDEENDMKWYQDKLKDDEPAPEKVKVKKEAVEGINIASVTEDIVSAAEKAMDRLDSASKQVIMTTKEAMEKMGLNVSDDPVNHPSHYTQGSIECIDAIEASMTKEEACGYLKGCVMKYVWRYRHKGGVEDLEKARWYLDRLIEKADCDD